MTSVAKDRTRLSRSNPIQKHNKHQTPGIIINYPIFYFIIIICDYISSYSLFYTIIPGVWCLL